MLRFLKLSVRFLTFCCFAFLSFKTTQGEEAIFPVISWGTVEKANIWGGNHKDPNLFSTMKECGINSVCSIAPEFLDVYSKSGMKKAWVMDPGLRGIINELIFNKKFPTDQEVEVAVDRAVKAYDQHPSVFGYYIMDEPSAGLFPAIGKISAALQRKTKKPFYVNLLPTYASPVTQLESKDYEEYVNSYIEKCKPTFLSYDHYALAENGTINPAYWENIDVIYKIAKEKKLPVIPIVMSVAMANFREATEADLLFQVFTHLAYGAKGIQYFSYLAPVIGNYRHAPIDQFGAKTPLWYSLQRVNRRIEVLAPILSKLQWVKSYHFGSQIPMEKGIVLADAESLVKAVKNYDKTIPNIMIGELKDAAGKDYLMVVNKDLKKSINVEFTFKTKAKAVFECSRWNGINFPWSGENAWISPGEGVLIQAELE